MRNDSGLKLRETADDLILDIQFDHFGTSYATSSADHKLRIYKKDQNGQYVFTAGWMAHSAAIWHIDWAHPRHGTVLASCSFDKQVKFWLPPAMIRSASEVKKSTEWVCFDSHGVDKRGSVTDVRFSPEWFMADHGEPNPKSGSKVYVACCTSDGQAKVYYAESPVNKRTHFKELRPYIIINSNNSSFRCTSLDWSRLRRKSQLIAIGAESNEVKSVQSGSAQDQGNFRLYKYSEKSPTEIDGQEGERACWDLLEDSSYASWMDKIEGTINLIRFANIFGGNGHTCAIAANNLAIISIHPDTFEVTPMQIVVPDGVALEKTWRLAWDKSGRVCTVHNERTLQWTRTYSNEDMLCWIGKPI